MNNTTPDKYIRSRKPALPWLLTCATVIGAIATVVGVVVDILKG
jgi:hypothetical protein